MAEAVYFRLFLPRPVCHVFILSLASFTRALSLPTTDLSFDDCRRIRTAAQLNLPMACHIIEYGRLTRMLFSTDLAVESPGVDSVAKQSRLLRITNRLREIAEATRSWHTQLSTCHWPSPALANLEPIFLHDGRPEEKAVSLLRQLTSALPKVPPDSSLSLFLLCITVFVVLVVALTDLILTSVVEKSMQ
ncbi:unnamed protein product, partial [Dibothriocephalus latus]